MDMMGYQEEIMEGVIEFSLSNYYREWKPYLLKLLRLSRSSRVLQSPIRNISLQLAMAKTITEAEEMIRQQRLELIKTDKNVIYNQRIRFIIKEIADGFAWRMLGFNRMLMRVLSQNSSPGYLKTTSSGEDNAAIYEVAKGSHVIINDITNILRIGDLTVISPEGYPSILEIKGSGKRKYSASDYRAILGRKGSQLSKQASKILEIDDAINKGVIELGDETAKIGFIDIPVYTYHSILKEILMGCLNNGICGRFMDKLMYVRAYKVDAADRINWDLPFDLNKQWHHSSSLETLFYQEPYRNKIPYSAYPFDDELIFALISGEIVLESFINLNSLKKYFEKEGWKVKRKTPTYITPEDRAKVFSGPKLFSTKIDSTIMTISKGGFNSEVAVEHLCNVHMDFIKPRIITDTASYFKELTEKDRIGGYFGTSYLNERYIWK